MRKWTVPMLVALLLFGAGVKAASADVFVAADVVKIKDIDVVEHLYVTKVIDILALYRSDVTKAANSDVIIDQVNKANHACANCDEKTDTLTNSANDNSGVLSVNQSAGNMNNQGSAVSAAVDVFPVEPPTPPTPPADPTGQGFASAQSALEQENGIWAKFQINLDVDRLEEGYLYLDDIFLGVGPVIVAGNTVNTVDILFRDAVIEDSIDNNSGIAHVNQATGNMNNQANGLAIAVSLTGEGAAMSEADLGQVNIANVANESDVEGSTFDPETGNTSPAPVGINKLASLVNSVNTNTGVIGVNQTVGNMANQANNVSFAAVVAPAAP